MIRRLFPTLAMVVAVIGPMMAAAQSVQSARPIKINTIVTQSDFVLVDAAIPGAFGRIEDAVGLETKKTLYPGRPVMVGDLGPITVVDRNQLVQLMDTRLVVTGVVTSPTTVEVQN